MTEDEMRGFAARHGLTGVAAKDLERMRELAVKVAETGLSLRRMAEKAEEPANVFRVPLRG
jgi:hypothetical protein